MEEELYTPQASFELKKGALIAIISLLIGLVVGTILSQTYESKPLITKNSKDVATAYLTGYNDGKNELMEQIVKGVFDEIEKKGEVSFTDNDNELVLVKKQEVKEIKEEKR